MDLKQPKRKRTEDFGANSCIAQETTEEERVSPTEVLLQPKEAPATLHVIKLDVEAPPHLSDCVEPREKKEQFSHLDADNVRSRNAGTPYFQPGPTYHTDADALVQARSLIENGTRSIAAVTVELMSLNRLLVEHLELLRNSSNNRT